MLSIASTIVSNEQTWRNEDVNKQYGLLMDAQEKASKNPDDFEAQILKVFQEDRLSHMSEARDMEMQRIVQETREYLGKL